MSDSLVQVLETSTMTTDRTGNKERTHSKDGESHASHGPHDPAAAQDHASRELPEGETLEEHETPSAEAENRNKNGQEKDDKKVPSSHIIPVVWHIRSSCDSPYVDFHLFSRSAVKSQSAVWCVLVSF